MQAESAYLFRHALLRDAAYQLQLPGDRAKLHALAFEIIEQLHGGRAPEPPVDCDCDSPRLVPHFSDAFALELAEHVRLAMEGLDGALHASDTAKWRSLLRIYLRRGALNALRVFDYGLAHTAWQALANIVQGSEQGDALRRAADAAMYLDSFDLAESLLKQALGVQRQCGDRLGEGAALVSLANLQGNAAQPEQSRQSYGLALTKFREIGYRSGEGDVLANLAVHYHKRGLMPQAEAAYAQALAIFEEVGNRRWAGFAMANQSRLFAAIGKPDLARHKREQALALVRETGNRRMEGNVLGFMADASFELGQFEEALRQFAQAMEIHRETGNRQMAGNTLLALSNVLRDTGRVHEAERALLDSLAMFRDLRDRSGEGVVTGNLASLYHDLGRPKEAEDLYRCALAIHLELGNRTQWGVVLGNLASLYAATGRATLAEEAFTKALNNHRACQNPRFEAEHLCDYACFLVQENRIEEARRHWQQGAALFREIQAPAALARLSLVMREACAKAGVPPIE